MKEIEKIIYSYSREMFDSREKSTYNKKANVLGKNAQMRLSTHMIWRKYCEGIRCKRITKNVFGVF